ncbi:LysE family translocator [Nguyenibacter vanlangensis]|uniref:LysE family translocator n=1 Tax=Nguyenibacter vanlangensis TaxID=1216886 RepID=A0A7Y7IVG5_9PROT|nr:LysE family translocator [Nguyenibacter vanlangensis]NVN11090.1 LysE family translocator [Nguyenibacter vanlangensis]
MAHYLIVLAVTSLAVISPGADFAMVSRNSFLHGRRSGVLSAFGIAVSCWIHVFYAVFFLATVQGVVPDLLTYVRFAGAAYLAYAGMRTMRSGLAIEDDDGARPAVSASQSFLAGFLTNALNPKTAVFVISLYTQVIGPHSTVQYALLCGATISLCHLVWFVLVSYGLSRSATRRWVMARAAGFNRVIGAILLLIGASLVFVERG